MDYFAMFDARSRLISSVSSLGWQMAIAIILPLIIGLKLDEHFGTKPSYTLTAFFLSIAICGFLIYTEYKVINAETAELFPDAKPRRTTRKTNKREK